MIIAKSENILHEGLTCIGWVRMIAHLSAQLKQRRIVMVDYIKREDAIEALGEEPYVWSDTDVEIAEHAQWVSDVKAIEAVPSADVVSREDYEGLELVCKNYEEALKDAVDELEESDRKRGKIITNEFGNESCSVCHYGLVLFITDENNTLIKPNFCPNCGADMRCREET